MKRMNVGVKVGKDKISVLLYADDVIIMSESGKNFLSLLDVVSGYGKHFGIKFSCQKNKIMIVSRSEDENIHGDWEGGIWSRCVNTGTWRCGCDQVVV